MTQALLLVRSHAFRHGRPLLEVAQEVLARRLRLGDNDGGFGSVAGAG